MLAKKIDSLNIFKYKNLCIIMFFCCYSLLAKAAVQVQVDPREVSLDEAFRLILTQDQIQNGGMPDLTPLQKEFSILGTERRFNYSSINGQTESSSEWTVTLKAQKSGELTIPVIKIGQEQTTPVTINVTENKAATSSATPQDSDSQNQQQGIFLKGEVDNKNPYVNQQIIYKVTLSNSKRLLDADYQGPQIENALLIPLGEEKHYKTQKNNVTYLVEEQDYAIFPQKSGTLTIKSPIFTALIYGFNPEHVKVQDKNLELKVQPIPKEYTGKEWLPAKEVTLKEQYETTNQKINQGNTLVRTITLEAIGIPAQLLPILNFSDQKGFNVYPEKANNKNQLTQGVLIGRSEVKVTYLFNKAGKITIPELKLHWFNTQTGKEEIATLAPRSMEVIPSPTQNQFQTPISKQENASEIKKLIPSPLPMTINWAWITASFFAFAWIVTLALWLRQKKTKQVNNHTNSQKSTLNTLHQACTNANPQEARDALLLWARLHWPDASIMNLKDLIRLTNGNSFKQQVEILSEVLYKKTDNSLWQGDELWLSVQNIKKNTFKKKRKRNDLPPSNPF